MTPPTAEQIAAFARLFAGNPRAHYVRPPQGAARCIKLGFELQDVERHLSGISPSLLSVPCDQNGLSHFGCLDVDRHKPDDPPVDWKELAIKITALHLPLIVCRSTGGRGAWVLLFIREPDGYSSAAVRAELARCNALLGLQAQEINPKQDVIAVGSFGSGVNLPYFGNSRIAFGENGEELDLVGFLSLAQKRTVWGCSFEQEAARRAPQDSADHPPAVAASAGEIMTSIEGAREALDGLLRDLACATHGRRNWCSHRATWYAARMHLAGLISKEEAWQRIYPLVERLYGPRERNLRRMLRDSWRYGIARGRLTLDFYPEDFPKFRRLHQDADRGLRFWHAWDAQIRDSGFLSATDAKAYMESRLKGLGFEGEDVKRLIGNSRLLDACASQLVVEIAMEKART